MGSFGPGQGDVGICVDLLVAEIGSTTTVVSAFDGLNSHDPVFLGQGSYPTTVEQGNVWDGLSCALDDLGRRLGYRLSSRRNLACSSAAGGLRMTVHGLVWDMTARAAKEAALGAGAVIKMMTAGKLSDDDVRRLREIRPNIVLLAGGVDGGETETPVHNGRIIASAGLDIPVIYAGNRTAVSQIRQAFRGSRLSLRVVENVYPRIDCLNVEPVRSAIQEVFEEHIVHAPGMERIGEWAEGSIMPVPGAVMAMAQALYEEIGDLMVVDIGGATTDIHSVTEGAPDINGITVAPEPLAKRTVEGDIGVYVNARNLVDILGRDRLRCELGDEGLEIAVSPPVMPTSPIEQLVITTLARAALLTAVDRHAGYVEDRYGFPGSHRLAHGRDLTAIKWIIGTGGVMARLPRAKDLLKACIPSTRDRRLLPKGPCRTAVDSHYIMAACGVMSRFHRKAAVKLGLKSIGDHVEPNCERKDGKG